MLRTSILAIGCALRTAGSGDGGNVSQAQSAHAAVIAAMDLVMAKSLESGAGRRKTPPRHKGWGKHPTKHGSGGGWFFFGEPIPAR
jgi:hypothetical protein